MDWSGEMFMHKHFTTPVHALVSCFHYHNEVDRKNITQNLVPFNFNNKLQGYFVQMQVVVFSFKYAAV